MDKSLRGSHLKLNLPHRCYFNALFWRINSLKLKIINPAIFTSQVITEIVKKWQQLVFGRFSLPCCSRVEAPWERARSWPWTWWGRWLVFYLWSKALSWPLSWLKKERSRFIRGLENYLTTTNVLSTLPLPQLRDQKMYLLLFRKIPKSCFYVTVSKAYIVQFEI